MIKALEIDEESEKNEAELKELDTKETKKRPLLKLTKDYPAVPPAVD